MNFRQYLLVMGLATAAVWFGWLLLIIWVDPWRPGFWSYLFFYLTLSFAIFGALALAGASYRVWRHPETLAVRQVSRAFRQAVLLTVITVGALFLSSLGALRWWTGTLLILGVAAIE